MTPVQVSRMRRSLNRGLRAALARMTESEQMTLVGSIESLHAALSRFIPILDNRSAEIATQAQGAVQKVGEDISRVLVMRHTYFGRPQMEIWESEGGSIACDAE